MERDIEKAKEILETLSHGVLNRIYVNVEHSPIFKQFGHGWTIGEYTYYGSNDNGQQIWCKSN